MSASSVPLPSSLVVSSASGLVVVVGGRVLATDFGADFEAGFLRDGFGAVLSLRVEALVTCFGTRAVGGELAFGDVTF